jgi:ketosteroid isomerase-like protein
MKASFRSCFALLTLLLAPVAARAADAEDPAHHALRQMKATYEAAIRTGDLAPLKPLFTSETSAVMLLGQEIKSFAELEEHWKHVRDLIGAGGTYTTTLNPETSLIYGEVALSRGTSDEHVKSSSGLEFKFTSRWTAVSRRIGSEWKVVRLHGSMDPVNNVFVTTFLQRAKLTYGLGGVALGLALAFGLGLLLKKRSAAA